MQKQPFTPFRVLTADGKHSDVRHPENLAFSGKGRRIAVGMDDESSVTLDLLPVTAIQRPISKAKAPQRRAMEPAH